MCSLGGLNVSILGGLNVLGRSELPPVKGLSKTGIEEIVTIAKQNASLEAP